MVGVVRSIWLAPRHGDRASIGIDLLRSYDNDIAKRLIGNLAQPKLGLYCLQISEGGH